MQTTGNLVIAYHGCDLATRDALIAGTTQLRPSRNPYDWLGSGIYFFEGDWQRALKFAAASFDKPEKAYTRERINTPAVVGAVIRIGHWLDMSTQQGIDEFEHAYIDLSGKRKKMPENKKADDDDNEIILRLLDRAVFDHLHAMRKQEELRPYDAVRGPFPQGHPIAPSSSIHRDTHVQLAVKNPACILGYFQVIEALQAEATLALRVSATAPAG